jgi:hypothetical protein
VLIPKLFDLLGKQSNQTRAISDAIAEYRKIRERAETIETELRDLRAERERIDRRISELETQRTAMYGFSGGTDKSKRALTHTHVYIHEASPHILRLLREKQAFSEAQGVHRRWLDEQLVNKVKGVQTDKAVSWGIIELRDEHHEVDHEGGKKSGRPIGKVWLLENRDKSVA